MGDNERSCSYTIDDLEALTLTVGLHDRFQMLDMILGQWDDQVIEKAAKREPGDLIFSGDATPDERPRERAESLIAGVTTDERTLRILADSQFGDVRVAVASNPATPRDALLKLAACRYGLIANTAALHPSLTVDDLHAVFALPGDGQRMGVLGHPDVPARLVHRAARAPSPYVRMVAARHRLLDVETLERLAGDADDMVRSGVAWNPHAPADVLARLARDSDDVIRKVVAQNPSTPSETLAALAADSVRWVRESVASRRILTAGLAEVLARDVEAYVRAALAANPACSGELLRRLARPGERSRVRHALAGNGSCPTDVLQRIAIRDRAAYIRLRAQRTLRSATAVA